MSDDEHRDDDDATWMEGDYPSEAALVRIEKWEFKSTEDFQELWEFVRRLWIYPDRFERMKTEERLSNPIFEDSEWYVSTGGWSGHEDIIEALQHNFIFWSLCWRVHRTGGHYWFRIALGR